MATKAEVKARKAEWSKALTEGRVVRFNDGLTMKSFATVAEAQAAVATMRANGGFGRDAEIVKV